MEAHEALEEIFQDALLWAPNKIAEEVVREQNQTVRKALDRLDKLELKEVQIPHMTCAESDRGIAWKLNNV